MTQQQTDTTSGRSDEVRGDDVTAGKGRRDYVGKTGIYPSGGPFPEGEVPVLTPGDINSPHPRQPSDVERNKSLKDSEGLPPECMETDNPESDRLGD